MKKLSIFAVVLASIVGFSACSSDDVGESQTPASKVVAHAVFSMQMGGGASTRATMDSNTLKWRVGDKLILASNGQINGTITCTEITGDGTGTFSGSINNFTPNGVNLYYLGDRDVSSMNPVFDFSVQQGSTDVVCNYILLKKIGLQLVEQLDGSYAPNGKVEMDAITSLLNLNLEHDGTPSTGYLAKAAWIKGLKNQISVNLANGEITASYINKAIPVTSSGTDNQLTRISPLTSEEYSNTFIIGVIPQYATDISIRVDYHSEDGDNIETLWNNINWNIGEGKNFVTNWTEQGDLEIVEVSSRTGYPGQAVDTGENNDGYDHKTGYNGSDV